MKGISGLLFVAFLAQFGHRSLSSSGAPLENPFPLGTIGCLASDVCGPGEVCKDDLLFGSCQNRHSRHGTIRPDSNRAQGNFHLKSRQIELLEDAILKLIQDGFTWQDAYTQCTLQNLLVAFQRNDHFNPGLCKDALGVSVSSSSLAKEADTEIAAILKELLQSTGIGRQEKDPSRPFSNLEETYEDDYPEEESNGLEASDYEDGGLDFQNSNKRDEFVQVHKYFDKSQGQLKRAHFLHLDENDDQYNFLTAFPEKPVREDAKDFLPEEEADGLQYMLKENVLDPDDLRDKPTGRFFDLSQVRQDSIGMESSMGSPEDAKEGSSGIVASDGTSDKENNGSLLSLSSSDQDTLEKLLEGSLDPDHLPVDKLRRLSRYIELMISLLEMQGNKHMDDVDVVTEESETLELPPTADNPIATQQAASSATKSAVEENVKEPVDDNVENKSDTDGEIAGKSAFLVAEPPPDSLNVDKKSPPIDDVIQPKSPEDESDKKAVVKTRYTYIKFDTNVNDEDAQRFLSNLTHMLKVPSELITLDQVDRDQIILKVDQDSPVNSSTLARDAEDNSDSLFTATGLKVVDAGIGKGVTVEVKKQDGGYVVLTFILVGSIAGVVLAVTIIYLIKRHRRSRDKLAQLAATADGNEASKDYQDLCRQRMQSKASEKPEPLHAASRIGSVSESQVRSPSSRSSTSSWSEEPAATNMDISTGHVVLSYMEDHLKNQDRLEQEWDALAAYQADPCSTSVASDPSNARKNRYSDVLPYDHSRVVLSATTNVSNSDYINASFITDHDPRNPAYITTQGPLPHTVADFWQMIWEQGSVVIVMLTKLTENGTAMCHRYWPEEGSDLYHIYEVHLVSEHIWCDDYLVRSFYLKNLQTNETRTVTQFHFLTWPHLAVPPSMKALLDFRRKVNKSFRGGSCPIVVHCNDGCGRSGTYCLIDMVLNRMAKGAKEIDMAATLEHIRDQRMNTVQTKEQFQFALSAVAEEVHAILKALPQ